MAAYRSILITGASSGIGEALALHFAEPSVNLWLSGRNIDRLTSVAIACQNQGATVEFDIVDVTDEKVMRAWIEKCDQVLPLDLVIANAGVSIGPRAGSIEDREQLDQLLTININGVLNTVYPAIETMQARQRGHIALVSSLAGYTGMPTAPAYSASKNFVKSWGEAIEPWLRKKGVAVSIICPGFVKSRITEKNRFPMPFLMTAEKAAKIIARGLKKRKLIIAFPLPMRFMVWLISLLPRRMANKLLGGLPKKK